MKSLTQGIKRRIKQYRCRAIASSQKRSIPVKPGQLIITTFYDVEGDYAFSGKTKPCFEALYKIAEIEEQCGIRSTYNVVAKLAQEAPELFRNIESAGHEIASHSFDHQVLTWLSRSERRENIYRAKEAFDRLGFDIVGHRSPQSLWDFSVIHDLKGAGYQWNAENESSIVPYVISRKESLRLWRMPVSMDDWWYEGDGIGPDEVLERWKNRVEAAQKVGGYMAIGFHPWVEAPGARMEAFSSFYHWISEQPGITTMPFRQIMSEVVEQ